LSLPAEEEMPPTTTRTQAQVSAVLLTSEVEARAVDSTTTLMASPEDFTVAEVAALKRSTERRTAEPEPTALSSLTVSCEVIHE
jgi:hypothetical protein